MDLTLSEDQELLVESARAFLARHCPTAVARSIEGLEEGHDPQLWSRVASLGWPGLMLPPEHGGMGQGLLELALLCEQLGRAPYSSPLVTSTTLVALPVLWAGAPSLRERLLPGLADGTLIGAPALLQEASRDEWSHQGLQGERIGTGWRISGTKLLVPFASVSDVLLATVRLDTMADLALAVIDAGAPGLAIDRHSELGAEPLFAVEMHEVEVRPERVIEPPAAREQLERALDHATVASIAYAVGLAASALELSLAHARTREQFGRPIGSFQAVAHRCVEMRADLDATRLLAYQAAWALDNDENATLAVSSAKAYASRAIHRIFVHAHQVHGAIGFSLEHDLQLFTRRAKSFELSLGSVERHQRKVWTTIEADGRSGPG